LQAFEPQLVMVSAGFDGDRRDPLAQFALGPADFGWLTSELVREAARHAQGRIVSMLEGGYHLQALAEGAVAHVAALVEGDAAGGGGRSRRQPFPAHERQPASAWLLHGGCGKLAAFPQPGSRRVRPAFRLLPLPICIALSLAAHADDDMPVDWSMCPLEDAVPLFPDAQPPVGDIADRDSLPTDIQGDQTVGVDGGIFNVTGNVTL